MHRAASPFVARFVSPLPTAVHGDTIEVNEVPVRFAAVLEQDGKGGGRCTPSALPGRSLLLPWRSVRDEDCFDPLWVPRARVGCVVDLPHAPEERVRGSLVELHPHHVASPAECDDWPVVVVHHARRRFVLVLELHLEALLARVHVGIPRTLHPVQRNARNPGRAVVRRLDGEPNEFDAVRPVRPGKEPGHEVFEGVAREKLSLFRARARPALFIAQEPLIHGERTVVLLLRRTVRKDFLAQALQNARSLTHRRGGFDHQQRHRRRRRGGHLQRPLHLLVTCSARCEQPQPNVIGERTLVRMAASRRARHPLHQTLDPESRRAIASHARYCHPVRYETTMGRRYTHQLAPRRVRRASIQSERRQPAALLRPAILSFAVHEQPKEQKRMVHAEPTARAPHRTR
mmetsp:Transcript_7954/g.26426  ORF Transcript_7954/g.26426 Transcript_7954/m.26426 type:complete len:402 (+) Transcript_7954:98-1303(+)